MVAWALCWLEPTSTWQRHRPILPLRLFVLHCNPRSTEELSETLLHITIVLNGHAAFPNQSEKRQRLWYVYIF